MIDDAGRSALGDLLRSTLGDFRRGIAPPQMRIGNALSQLFIAGPVDTGILAFLVESEANFQSNPETIGLGIMYVAYDFSGISFRLIEDFNLVDVSISQIDAIGSSVRFTANNVIDNFSFAVHIPAVGDATFISQSDTQETTAFFTAVYGNYVVAYINTHTGGPAVGRFDSDGVYIEVQHMYKTTPGDVGLTTVPSFYDGVSVFMSFGAVGAPAGIVKVSASSPALVSAVTLSAPGTIQNQTPQILGGNGSTIVGFFNRGSDSPVFYGLGSSGLTLLWAKSTKKQESTVTILVNDTVSTYRITISGQFVEVAGNAGGAAATAADLKNQCAASGQSQFVKRTFTMAGDTVMVVANDAGILYTFESTVTGGTGTTSTTNDQHLLPVTITSDTAQRADADGRLAIPCERYGVLMLDVNNGDVLSAAVVENPPPSILSSAGASIIGGVTYLSSLSEFPESFGPEPDFDWQLFRFETLVNNRSVLLDDVALTISSFAMVTAELTQIPNLPLTEIPVTAPLDAFNTEETEYTY